MQVMKCDRCGKYFDENKNPKKTGIVYMDINDDASGDRIDLCDACIAKLDAWLGNAIKTR